MAFPEKRTLPQSTPPMESIPNEYTCRCPNCGKDMTLTLTKAAEAPVKEMSEEPAMRGGVSDESAMLGRGRGRY